MAYAYFYRLFLLPLTYLLFCSLSDLRIFYIKFFVIFFLEADLADLEAFSLTRDELLEVYRFVSIRCKESILLSLTSLT